MGLKTLEKGGELFKIENKRTMKKQIVLCFCLLACVPATLAQRLPAKWMPWSKESVQHLQGTRALQNINISRQLERRLSQSYRQAKQIQSQLPVGHTLIMGEPVQQILHTWELNPTTLYPNQTFLKTHEQTGRYLAARNNRLFVQEMKRMKKIWTQIETNLPRLKQEAADTEQPSDQVQWLVQQIAPQTTQLFLGEEHGYPEIRQFVAQLVGQLRTKQPTRPIILLTEFLPENFSWTHHANTAHLPEGLHPYFAIWDQLLENQVPVIGLEHPLALDDSCNVRYLNDKGILTKQTVWASLEGVRLRNERWQKTLQQYRANFPDALFIIYAGADHVMYNRPFTLAANSTEKPFVAILYPNQRLAYEPKGRFAGTMVAKPVKGPLERLIDNLDLQNPIVKWTSPDLPAVAGFDVRIKVPVDLETRNDW